MLLLKKSDSISSQNSISLLDTKKRLGSLTLLKQRCLISGYQCLLEAKLDYNTDSLIFKVALLEN